jgi:hypothetical protein
LGCLGGIFAGYFVHSLSWLSQSPIFLRVCLLALARGKKLVISVAFEIQFWLNLGTNLQVTAKDLAVCIP